MESHRISKLGALLAAGVLATACGGGGGSGGGGSNDDGTDGTDPADSTSRLQFIEASSSGLLGHLPASPGNTTTIDADASFSNVNSIPVLGATWNNGQTDNGYIQEVVYQDSNGYIMRVSTDASNGIMPSPQRVSYNSATASEFNIGQDFADVNNARVAFRNDSTGEWWWTKLGWDESIKSKPFPGIPLVDLIDPGDGSHDGWLALDAGEIKYRDPDPAVTATTVPGSPSGINAAAHLESIQTGEVLLNIDGQLWTYRPGSRLTNLGHTFTYGSGQSETCATSPSTCPVLHVVDDSELFFIDDDSTEGNDRLYRTDLANDTVKELDQNPSPDSSGFGGRRLAVSSNRVIWSYQEDPTPGQPLSGDEETIIRTLDKDTGNGMDLDQVTQLSTSASAQNQSFLDRTGDWFFYTKTDTLGGAPTAVAARVDGSTSYLTPNATWRGVSTNLISFANLNRSLKRVYRIDNITTAGDFANKNIKSVSASSPGTALNLDTIPADAQGFILTGGFGIQRLAFIDADDGAGGQQQDVLYLDGNTEGSLQRVTDTTGEDENPGPFF